MGEEIQFRQLLLGGLAVIGEHRGVKVISANQAPDGVASQGDYQVVQTVGGASVHSVADRETFHPVAGPEAEATALYVRQMGLVERAQRAGVAGEEFVIWDVGLGAGGNICTVLRALQGGAARLRVISFERTLAPLEFAITQVDQLPFLRGFDAKLRELTEVGTVGLAELGLAGAWELRVGDFTGLVRDAHAVLPSPDAVLFDAYSPARNPAMWSLPVFAAIRSRVLPGRSAQLATFSRATLVRTALLLAGWFVGSGESIAGKEETTVAATERADLKAPLGRSFLRRAEVSDAAEPLDGGEYRRARLSAELRDRLGRHPQFQEKPALDAGNR